MSKIILDRCISFSKVTLNSNLISVLAENFQKNKFWWFVPTTFIVEGLLFSRPWVCRAWLLKSSFSDPVPPDPRYCYCCCYCFIPALTKGLVGNAFIGRRLSLHNDILGLRWFEWRGWVGGWVEGIAFQRVTKTLYMTLGPKFFLQ